MRSLEATLLDFGIDPQPAAKKEQPRSVAEAVHEFNDELNFWPRDEQLTPHGT